ncbi:MAG: hypothetical protein HN576_10270 [Bacteriovoracaceae bacterium]|jgi:hypothetical protein|nr:hypothetical protein [Bacteriovoracaceae bacterium]
MKNPFKNVSKKVIVCPSCQTKSRVPIRPNKTLEVCCPSCQTKFHIQFKNPLMDFFTWYKGKGLIYNLKSFGHRYKLLAFSTRLKIFIIGFVLIYTIIGSLTMTKSKKNHPKTNESAEQTNPYSVEI